MVVCHRVVAVEIAKVGAITTWASILKMSTVTDSWYNSAVVALTALN